MQLHSLNLAVEGNLDEAVLRRILREMATGRVPAPCYGHHGKDYLRKLVFRLNPRELTTPWIIMVDLDCDLCPPDLIEGWTDPRRNPQILIRVAVREVESWLLAHRDGIAGYLGVEKRRIPLDPDSVEKPKELLIDLAKRSKRKAIREDLVPAPRSTSKIGKGYNSALRGFVERTWDISKARQRSQSLDAAIRAISQLVQGS